MTDASAIITMLIIAGLGFTFGSLLTKYIFNIMDKQEEQK